MFVIQYQFRVEAWPFFWTFYLLKRPKWDGIRYAYMNKRPATHHQSLIKLHVDDSLSDRLGSWLSEMILLKSLRNLAIRSSQSSEFRMRVSNENLNKKFNLLASYLKLKNLESRWTHQILLNRKYRCRIFKSSTQNPFYFSNASAIVIPFLLLFVALGLNLSISNFKP